jgi:hypothetical protein
MLFSKKEIKREILARFRGLSPDSGYILPRRWVEDCCLRQMRPSDRAAVNAAVRDLVALGILDEVDSGLGRLRLTDKGALLILNRGVQRRFRRAWG